MIVTGTSAPAEANALALAERVFNATVDIADLATIYLGDRLAPAASSHC